VKLNLPGFSRSLGTAGWLAAGVCISVAVLTVFGYRAIRGWQLTSTLLLEQRTAGAADLLVSALTRDMHAVQRSVLTSTDWDEFDDNLPNSIGDVVGNAFAKYPYPETFFIGRAPLRPEQLLFFTRSDRPPPWQSGRPGEERFPVTESTAPDVARAIVVRMAPDESLGRSFAVAELQIDGVPYQVVARLRYTAPDRTRMAGLFGFMVNLDWVRRHYFQGLTTQVARMGGATSGLALAVRDERNRVVASTAQVEAGGISTERPFPLMFFDPLLVAVVQPAGLARTEWIVAVTWSKDATLDAAIAAAHRTLVLTAFAAVSLAIGLVLIARAVNAGARLSALRSEFVSTVTHELKTPIASIRAIGDTLASGRISSPEGQREYAQLTVQEAKRLTRLVDNLLALSRITDVTEVYSFEPLALESLVEHALEGFRQQIDAAGFTTIVDIPQDLPLILGDQTALRLMLDNLIDNAIRYSPAERWVRISAAQGATMIALQVTDHGRGIPAEEINLVTRKFFRGQHYVSSGSGLGLAIVKRIVADHRGELVITSRVDAGTTVTATLPMADGYE
jgi:signal transduction histidine kinase